MKMKIKNNIITPFLLLLLLVLLSYLFYYYIDKINAMFLLLHFTVNLRSREHFTGNHRTAFCLLVREPQVVWLDFLNSFTEYYDVFIAIDNQIDYTDIKQTYSNITFIQIGDDKCEQHGYINSDYYFKPVVATDRAFYYFNRINKKYDHIWFCEDDVFMKNVNSIVDLDQQYPTDDFIVPNIEMNRDGQPDGWSHWQNIDGTLSLPWAHHIICLTRISRELMNKVDEFVQKHHKLIYKEILFHTLALHNNMSIITPSELSKIRYPEEWDMLDIIGDHNRGEKYIYHPIKDIQKHIEIRKN